jgi:pyruvate formate lyase activating enzyme
MTADPAERAEAAALCRRGELGFVHSRQIGSALDGPGLRTVFFLSGCALRCQYCHNPDTWKLRRGVPRTPRELLDESLRYARFTGRSGGGLTLSGGEPLVQAPFCSRVLAGAKAHGLHTALDTNGYLGARLSDAQLQDVDLVLLDLKSWDETTHRLVTGVSPAPVLAFARRLASLRRPIWVRFVLVPGLTDEPSNVASLAQFCGSLGNVQRVDVLPFHQMGRYKWRELGLPYALESTAPARDEDLERARAVFRAAGLRASS